MVFNLIDFLLGAKKPKGGAKPGAQPNQAQAPQGQQAPASNTSPQPAATPAPGPNGATPTQEQPTPAQNAALGVGGQNAPDQPNFQDNSQPASGNAPGGSRTKVTEVLGKIQEDAKSSSEKLSSMLTDMKNIENSVNTLNHRVDDLEEAKKVTDQKLSEMDGNMTKFLSLYELINNQYNPFVDKTDLPQIGDPKEIMLDAQGNAMPEVGSGGESLNYNDTSSGLDKGPATVDLTTPIGGSNPSAPSSMPSHHTQRSNDFDAAILELDTLDIQEAAADAVPLTRLKTNTNSLVTILSWLEYLIRKVGIDETRNTLRYYTEVLRWITPEVFFDLDKYLKGMTDKKSLSPDDRLSVKDHIVSLYFISKLNEKALDDKLTRAVLQIIKQ